MHESSSYDKHDTGAASPKSFGLLLALIFAGIALWPLAKGKPLLGWMLALSAVLLFLAVFAPALLSGPTRAWLAFGGLLSKVAAPLALGIVFFGVFTVYGGLLRLFGRDILNLRANKVASSHWLPRTRSDQQPSHFSRQF